MYGIIICSKCKKAKIIDISKKTTKCPKCNKLLYIQNQKIFSKSNDQEKLRDVIGVINAEINGSKKEFKNLFDN